MTALRIARRMDQPRLAKSSGIAIEDIQALEQGRLGGFTDPDYLAGLLLRLCQVFEIDSAILTRRIFRLMAELGRPESEPDATPEGLTSRTRYFHAGILALTLIIPFAGLWWIVRY